MLYCGIKLTAQLSAHHGATGENGLVMNRYPLLSLESEGRGGEVIDGIESMHFFNQKRKS